MTARFDNGNLSALRLEMIFCLVKRDAGALLQMPQHFFRKIDMPVQPRADCCPAKGQLSQNFDRFFRARLCISNLLGVTRKFLTNRIGLASNKYVRPNSMMAQDSLVLASLAACNLSRA